MLGMRSKGDHEGASELTRNLHPLNAWALSLGSLLGWGAFVMPGTMFLPSAGPLGTFIAIVVAGLLMVVIAVNTGFLSKRNPDSGGGFAFTRDVFGYDHAFLCSWAIALAYIAIMWANATAIPLVAKYLIGPIYQVGYLYQIAGYDVYLGEALLTLGALMLFGVLSCAKKRFMNAINTILALVLVGGSAACLFVVIQSGALTPEKLSPSFSPTEDQFIGVTGIIALTPWAFSGFEAVSHAAGELRFSPGKLGLIMIAAIVSGAFIYIAMTFVSIGGIPEGYPDWPSYIADLGNLGGIKGLPTFNAIYQAAGDGGLALLAVTLISAIATSLLSLYRALSRLIYSIAREDVLPSRYKKLSTDGVPRRATGLIMVLSIAVPFVGRAAIGWIVDVTTVCAAIVYGYISMCCFVQARSEGLGLYKITGVIGIISSLVFLAFPLVPNIWTLSALAPESYLILAVWSVLGLAVFYYVFRIDRHNRFGKSPLVWVFTLLLILAASTMWARQKTDVVARGIVSDMSDHYAEQVEVGNHAMLTQRDEQEETYLSSATKQIDGLLQSNSVTQIFFIVISVIFMANIYRLMIRRQREIDAQRIEAEQMNRAKTEFLSSMSHDIRTPMNAVIGYTHLAKRDGMSLGEVRGFLNKIDHSSKHLLDLINDVLEMSRIESGKMELSLEPCDLCQLIYDVRDMFATQMSEKNIAFEVVATDIRNRYVLCDEPRLNRVLLNLLSNAYKFTPEGGSISLSLTQTADEHDGVCSYELRVADTGIGMSEEFAAKVFEAFEREQSSTVDKIQGTGLGMAITKSIVDLMNGTIEVQTALGEGTEFRIGLDLVPLEEAQIEEKLQAEAQEAEDDLSILEGKHALVVDDNDINREIASMILEDVGMVVDTAENGKIAVDKVIDGGPGCYDVILMDVRMPVMDGREATRIIRGLDNKELASMPIIAAAANAFSDEVNANLAAGMDAHVSKPLDVNELYRTLADILRR